MHTKTWSVSMAMLGLVTPALAFGTTLPTARADSDFFVSPSGNISCGLGIWENSTASAVCEIREHIWVAPARPNPCMGAWGDRISLRQGGSPQMSCHSDTVQGTGYPALQYGQSRSLNSLTCESEQAGITCTDKNTGHYFRLSRDSYELH